jgi:hypothetical protein
MISESVLGIISKILESIYFVTIVVVGILTFISAKRTILQPIKTEIFKIQLGQLTEVLKYFVGKDEIELRKQFDFENLMLANTTHLFDNYAQIVFNLKIDPNKRPYNHKECPSSLVKAKFLEPIGDYVDIPPKKEIPKTELTKEDRLKIWQKYEIGEFHLTKKYVKTKKLIRRFISSPVLPKKCISLLEEYIAIVDKNVDLMCKVLKKTIKLLPKKYPTLADLKIATMVWVDNKFHDYIQDLEPKSKEIIEFI